MKQLKKIGRIVAVVAVGLGALVPLVKAYAITDSEETTISATIASVISFSTSTPTVTFNMAPTATGSQSQRQSSISVSTNNSTGYTVTISTDSSETSLVNGADEITAVTGTVNSPVPLTPNSWGFRVSGGVGGFVGTLGSFSPFDNWEPQSSPGGGNPYKYAGVPPLESPVVILDSSAPGLISNRIMTYGVLVDTTIPAGTYTNTVVWTATTKP